MFATVQLLLRVHLQNKDVKRKLNIMIHIKHIRGAKKIILFCLETDELLLESQCYFKLQLA